MILPVMWRALSLTRNAAIAPTSAMPGVSCSGDLRCAQHLFEVGHCRVIGPGERALTRMRLCPFQPQDIEPLPGDLTGPIML